MLAGRAARGLLVVNAVAAGRGVGRRGPGPRRDVGRASNATLPEVLSLGDQGAVTWRIDNPPDRRVRVAVADELAPSLHARHAAGIGVGCVRTAVADGVDHRHADASRPVRARRPSWCGSTGRSGWRRGSARSRCPAVLRVYPPFRSRDEAELRINKARILEVGLRSAQGRGGGTEFDQLREYTVDDEFRRIDWAATARTGKAIVRTYRAERNQTVVVPARQRPGDGRAGRRRAPRRARHGRGDDAHRRSRPGSATVPAWWRSTERSGPSCPPGQARDQLGRVTEAMYELEPAAGRERLPRRVHRDAGPLPASHDAGDLHRPGRAGGGRESAARAAAHRAQPRGRGGERAGSRGRAVGVGRGADDATEAYRKAAAVAALEERRRTAARLRGLGATVVDAPPGRMAPRLADAYLRVKATGRL